MQIHLNSFLGWCLIIFLLTSCGSASHHFYAGDEGNLLALKEKGDLKVSAGYTPHLNNMPGNNVNAQIGYSPIKHLGLYGSFFRIRNTFDGVDDIEQNVYQYNFSAAAGTYFFKPVTVFDDDESIANSNRGLLFDFYAGYSRGAINNFFFGETGRIELDFGKVFAQGGVHIFLDRVSASFALRYAHLRYFDGGLASGKLTASELDKKVLIEENNPFNFLESALKISFGKPSSPLKAYMTITGVYDFGDVFLEIQPSTLQLGVTADLDYYFKK